MSPRINGGPMMPMQPMGQIQRSGGQPLVAPSPGSAPGLCSSEARQLMAQARTMKSASVGFAGLDEGDILQAVMGASSKKMSGKAKSASGLFQGVLAVASVIAESAVLC